MEQMLQIRKEKGQQIASAGKVRFVNNRWLVPSQTHGNKYYIVVLKIDKSDCNCPDFTERDVKCKHIFAVEITITKTVAFNDSVSVTETKRITYPQNWEKYNKSQTSELKLFDELLKELLEEIDEPTYKFGRPTLPLREQIFCSIIKVSSQLSSRRASMLHNYALERGFIQHKPHFNVVSKLLNRSELTPILYDMINITSMPLKAIETDFAVDSSGFGTIRLGDYIKTKYRIEKSRLWLKAHVCCGVKTNIITAVEIDGEYSGDNKKFIPLVQKTHDNGFAIKEVSADKAYSGRKNLAFVDSLNAMPFIPFKSNTSSKMQYPNAPRNYTWGKMYHYFMYNKEEFLTHYHKRSNVESTFSAIKRKFGDGLKSKNRTAQINELLCKLIAYNITVLIREMQMLRIISDFTTPTSL